MTDNKQDNIETGTRIFAYLNEIRSDPQIAVKDLEHIQSYYKGKFYCHPSLSVIVETREGLDALNEAIAHLKVQTAVPKLNWNIELAEVSRVLTDHIGENGLVSHGDGVHSLDSRLENIKKPNTRLAENLIFGHSDPKEIVLHMLIDDGVKNRKNRSNLLDGAFNEVGVAFREHKDHRTCCVIDLQQDNIQNFESMDAYFIDRKEWPIDAVSVEKHFVVSEEGGSKTVISTFEFTLAGGERKTLTKKTP
jgi:uncharacterized protein YkwD